MSEAVRPNVGADLLRIHRALTRGIQVSLQQGASFEQEGFPSPEVREGYLLYLKAMKGVLDAHHLTEEEITFPAMREKTPNVPFDKLLADHRAIVDVLEALEPAAEAATADGAQADALHELNGILGRLSRLWYPHIAKEESFWNPETIAALLSEEENLAIGRRTGEDSQKHLHAPAVELPFLLYNLEPEDRAIMMKPMPPAVTQELIPVAWREQWAPMKPFLLE
jgi:hypothetical protein